MEPLADGFAHDCRFLRAMLQMKNHRPPQPTPKSKQAHGEDMVNMVVEAVVPGKQQGYIVCSEVIIYER